MSTRYVLQDKLGQGGFGEVWRAWDTESQRLVAIKYLMAPDAALLERFEREARMYLREHDNPHVVSILDHQLQDSRPYLVLEYCPLGSLDQWVGRSNSWQQVALVLGHSILGLKGLHDSGGFHRDIKPGNLLLGLIGDTGQKIVKVSDFGLARLPEPLSQSPMTKRGCGTPGYIAPEVLAGHEFSSKADVYSLGITAVELLTGGKDPALVDQIKAPQDLVQLLRRMIHLDPAGRPALEQVAESLKAIFLADKALHDALAAQEPEEAVRPLGFVELLFGGLAVFAMFMALKALIKNFKPSA